MLPQIEYVGFKPKGSGREYTLRVRPSAGDPQDFTVVIPNEAFLARRVRYQDAPEICFLKLQRELAACAEGFPTPQLTVGDADFEEYRLAHTKTPQRRTPSVVGT
jgi:hypothetical protein